MKNKTRKFSSASHMSRAMSILPTALGCEFVMMEREEVQVVDGTAVLKIRGPLMHRADPFFDSYEEICSDVDDAIESGAKRIVMDIDSPGGLVAGAFEGAKYIRAIVEENDVELFAYVDAQATSAAYAIASAATYIGISETAELGSIGVIAPIASIKERNAREGIDIRLVTSGERKGDGWEDAEITDDVLKAKQASVDQLAQIFFDTVSGFGWGGTPENIRDMQASVVHGSIAIDLGLATEITTIEKMMRRDDATREDTEKISMDPIEEARAALTKAAEGEDEDMAKVAKAALAALDGEPDGDEPKDDDEDEPKDDEDESATEDDEDETASEDDDEDAKSIAARALAEVHAMKMAQKKAAAASRMDSLIASRPDLSKDLASALRAVSYKEAKRIIGGLPKAPTNAASVASQVTATGVRGEGVSLALPSDEKSELDRMMGLGKSEAKTVHTEYKMTFGARGAK